MAAHQSTSSADNIKSAVVPCRKCGKEFERRLWQIKHNSRQCVSCQNRRRRDQHRRHPEIAAAKYQRIRNKDADKIRLRGVWSSMIQRCHNPKNRGYPRYGGRGITVCDSWRTSFAVFCNDMGPKPSSKHTIERKDNDGPYDPSNCVWATVAEQNRNQRSNRRLTFNGKTYVMTAWAKITGIPYLTIRARIDRLGYSVERALTQPARKLSPRKRSEQSSSNRGQQSA